MRSVSIIATTATVIAMSTAPALAGFDRLAVVSRGDQFIDVNPIGDLAGINPQNESVWLVDADADEVITSITNGDVFDRALLPPNLSVMVEANEDTESVQFGYGGTLVVRTQSVEPCALGGDVIIGNSIIAENTIWQQSNLDTYGPDCSVGASGSFTSYRGNVIGELTDACPLVDPHVGDALDWDTFGTTDEPFDVHLGGLLSLSFMPTIWPLADSVAVDHGTK